MTRRSKSGAVRWTLWRPVLCGVVAAACGSNGSGSGKPQCTRTTDCPSGLVCDSATGACILPIGEPDGGAGAATGGSGGTSGSSGSAGAAAAGGIDGSAGAAGGVDGGAGTAAGGAGAGGSAGAADGVGVPGQACAPEGAAACGGHAVQAQLTCVGGVWQKSGSCSGSENCDTSAAHVGTCQAIASVCIGKMPGAAVCVGNAAGKCGVDLVTVDTVQTCTNQACVNGVCTGACTPGATKPCYDADPSTESHAPCMGGTSTCSGQAIWGPCVGEVLPAAQDNCNAGDDSNCDGVPNEGCVCTAGQSTGCGNCGTASCLGGASPSGWGTCTNQGVCAPGSSQTCNWSYPYGCPATQAYCASSCQWGLCVPSPTSFAPYYPESGVCSGTVSGVGSDCLTHTYTSGPNCFGSTNTYGPFQVCPTGSHLVSWSCNMITQCCGYGTNGSCSVTKNDATHLTISVHANNNCTVNAQASFSNVTCVPDTCGN